MMFFAMIESHLNSNLLPGVLRLHKQNLFHPFSIIDVVIFVSGSFMKNNLHIVIVLAVPHSLKYLLKNLLRRKNEQITEYSTDIRNIYQNLFIAKIY
jgi:hypothetical protein